MFSLMGNCCSCIRRKRQPKRSITLAILGLDSAGKTTTTKALLGDELNTAPTIGFNKEEFDFANYAIVMYDLGGGKKIRDIWKDYLNEIYGVVYVIDSSVRERMAEVKENIWALIGHEMVKTKPLLLLANKEDIQGHMDEVDIMEQLEIEDLVNINKCPCKMIMCSAIKGSGKKMDPHLKEGMTWLCSVLDQSYDTLKVRVTRDMEAMEAKRQKEKEERRERVRKQREERERLQEEEDKKLGIKKEEEEEDEDDADIVDGANPFKRLTAEEIQKKDEKYKLAKEKEKERQKRLKQMESQEKVNPGFTVDNNVNSHTKGDDQDDDLLVPRSSRSLGSYGLWSGPPLGRKKLNPGSDEDGDSDATMPRSGRQLLPPLQSPLGTKFMEGNNTNTNKDKKKKKKTKQKDLAIEEFEESTKENQDNHVYGFDNYGQSTMSVSKIAVMSKHDDSDDNSDNNQDSDRNLDGKDKYFKNTSPTPTDSGRKKKVRNKSHDNDVDGFDTLRLSQHYDDEDMSSHTSISPLPKNIKTKNDYNSSGSATPVKKLKKKNKHLRKNKLAPSDDEYELSDVQSPKKSPLPWARAQSPGNTLSTIPDDRGRDDSWGFAEDLAPTEGNQPMRRSRPNFDNDDLIL